MLNIFKKKKKVNTAEMLLDNDKDIMKIMDGHLDLIQGLQKQIGGLIDNDSDISKIVNEQHKAINDLQNQVEALRKLIDQTDGS